jgi:hypothetical protein
MKSEALRKSIKLWQKMLEEDEYRDNLEFIRSLKTWIKQGKDELRKR